LAAQEKRVSLDQLEQEVILDLLVVREHPAGLEILAFPAIPDFQVSVLAAAVFFFVNRFTVISLVFQLSPIESPSCIFPLLPPPRDPAVTSRLRTACPCLYPQPVMRTKRFYISLIEYYRQACPRGSMSVLHLLSRPKWVFCPARATHCSDKRETVGPVPCAKFHHHHHHFICLVKYSRLSGRNVGIAPKTVKIWNFDHKFASHAGATCLHNYYEMFGISTRPLVAFMFLIWSLSGHTQPSYKHFPSVGAFSHKFSITPSDESNDRVQKS